MKLADIDKMPGPAFVDYVSRHDFGRDRAVVITNRFTEGAKELARSNHCELIDRDVLAKWILEFQEAMSSGSGATAVQ